MDEDFVRTADGKGVHPHDIVRRHAAPMSYPGTFSFIAVSAPLIITNMVLVVLGLIADGIVSRFDPRVRSSQAQAW
jgi:ABC-type dipeptide/oligopeptide/nickel transport system permease component